LIKQSHYRPGQSVSVLRSWCSHISRQSTHECGKIVSPTYRPPLTTRNTFLLEEDLTLGSYFDQEYMIKKFQLYHQESNTRPSCLWRSASTNLVAKSLLGNLYFLTVSRFTSRRTSIGSMKCVCVCLCARIMFVLGWE
jgi:hypothetical protein